MEKRQGNGRRTQGGFTLLETLISLCVLGLILSAVYGSYRAVTGTVAGLQPGITLDQKGRFFVQRLARQIRCSYGGRVVAQAPPSFSDQKDARPVVSQGGTCFFRGGGSSFDEALVQFVTTSNNLSRTSDPGGLAMVSYKLDAWQRALLVREEVYGRRGPENDRDWQVVLENVRDLELQYFNGTDWRTEWDANAVGRLPRAVRIRLELESEQDGRLLGFTSVAPIGCSTPPPAAGAPRVPMKADRNRRR
ncbi:MAG: prepilin-type N-terminal cleavage/methylation domain-containing protein [Planctomycetes bacterium]|jgi:prepilin-type N-terminal cleavage/methylation domain-containing protein|nr:prepilin-type N-terminal cleavage/methylation domain-containing protein [Planctomycetota bacterium]